LQESPLQDSHIEEIKREESPKQEAEEKVVSNEVKAVKNEFQDEKG
jgi:hypothetical protein